MSLYTCEAATMIVKMRRLAFWPKVASVARAVTCLQSWISLAVASCCFQKGADFHFKKHAYWFRKWQCFYRVADDAYIKKKLAVRQNYYLAWPNQIHWMIIVVVKTRIDLSKTFRKNICALYLDESEFWPISERVHCQWILRARLITLAFTNLTNFSFVRHSLGRIGW